MLTCAPTETAGMELPWLRQNKAKAESASTVTECISAAPLHRQEPKSPNYNPAQQEPQNHPATPASDPVSRISSCIKVAELKFKKPHNRAIYCVSR